MAVRNTARFEKTAARFAPSISADRSNRLRRDSMIKITNAQLWVHDQDEALAFYTEKVGMEVRADVTVPELGNFRWLTVGLAGQDVSIVLMAIPGPPVMDAETTEQVRTLMAKGFAGMISLTTEDCQPS